MSARGRAGARPVARAGAGERARGRGRAGALRGGRAAAGGQACGGGRRPCGRAGGVAAAASEKGREEMVRDLGLGPGSTRVVRVLPFAEGPDTKPSAKVFIFFYKILCRGPFL